MDNDPQNPYSGTANPATPPPPPPAGDPGLPPPPVGNAYSAQQSYSSQPTGVASENDRLYVAILHLSPILAGALAASIGMPFLNFLAPLIMWLIKKDQSRFIDDQGKESLNFNITVALALFALFVFSVITIGIGLIITVPLMIVIGIGALVLTIIAAIKGHSGEYYRYPFTFRFIK